MFVSKTTRYALQAATDLAKRWDENAPSQAAEIADRTGVPKNYLSKVLHQLARGGVCLSERGPKGGFRLARNPSEIPLAEVVEAVDPSMTDRQCLLGRPACRDSDPCPAHAQWKTISEELDRFLHETSLADLVLHR